MTSETDNKDFGDKHHADMEKAVAPEDSQKTVSSDPAQSPEKPDAGDDLADTTRDEIKTYCKNFVVSYLLS